MFINEHNISHYINVLTVKWIFDFDVTLVTRIYIPKFTFAV